VLEIPGAAAAGHAAAPQIDDIYGGKCFWTQSPKKQLLVIATPFRKGRHFAQRPNDFLPIIEHLEMLHRAGYVHGDIRAFNTVFPEEEGDQGCLIDFDYSGKAGEVVYPKGYNRNLDDGERTGKGGNKIEKWQDWYALGQLIFYVHQIDPPSEDVNKFRSLFLECERFWLNVRADGVDQNKVAELKDLLKKLNEKNCTIQLRDNFKECLEESAPPGLRTKQGATGSPPKGPHR
jgi:serine/threonine protein kinase